MHRDQDERENQDQEKNENPSGFSSDINQDKGDFDVPESCTKVAADFVSAENIHECLRLTEEFRLLPKNHRAREDELEVKKMILHAVNNAVSDFEKFGDSVTLCKIMSKRRFMASCVPILKVGYNTSRCAKTDHSEKTSARNFFFQFNVPVSILIAAISHNFLNVNKKRKRREEDW
ncbi:unnamed protein product [Fraxinus pennsylvanica]|uniref:Uncharacterized protein n=1 Tax=Fraxinus pennsylvanica TaxID=56036 RepID=A0AAD2AAJ2_9LAMI|nr:unnamed protein product [Fraxinus pennsylvanica]